MLCSARGDLSACRCKRAHWKGPPMRYGCGTLARERAWCTLSKEPAHRSTVPAWACMGLHMSSRSDTMDSRWRSSSPQCIYRLSGLELVAFRHGGSHPKRLYRKRCQGPGCAVHCSTFKKLFASHSAASTLHPAPVKQISCTGHHDLQQYFSSAHHHNPVKTSVYLGCWCPLCCSLR